MGSIWYFVKSCRFPTGIVDYPRLWFFFLGRMLVGKVGISFFLNFFAPSKANITFYDGLRYYDVI